MGVLFYFAASLLLFFISHRFLSSHKNYPPSPPSLPIIGHLHLFKKPLHRTLAQLSSQYGPVMLLRFGSRRVVVVSSPSAAEECFTKNDVVLANRPHLPIQKHLNFNNTTLPSASYGPHWRNLRRISTIELLSTARINMLSPVRSKEIQAQIRLLFRDSDGGFRKVELKSKFLALTFNIMMQMIAGKRYYGENVEDIEEARQFVDVIEHSLELFGATNLGEFLPFVGWIDFQGSEKRSINLQKKRDGLLQALIDKRREERGSSSAEEDGKGKKTMIDILLSLQESQPEYYTDEIIKGLMSSLLGAGTDTSALTMEWSMALLLNHPEALDKAKAEIDTQVGQDRMLDESDLPMLPYLHHVINETLRLYPVAPLLVPHESSEECTVGGFNVPCRTILLANSWAIHRDPKVWEDANNFKPERFESLEGGREGIKFLPFGHGRRACPGASLAMREVQMALGTLIQCFEWKRVGEEKVDMNEGSGLTMPKAKPLEALYKPHRRMINILSQL